MLQKFEVLNEMRDGYVVAVVRGNTKEEAVEIAKQAFKGGIRSLEITFTTPDAAEVIAELASLNEEGMIIGAGTVLDDTTARIAIMKGARYIVSPHFDRNISGKSFIKDVHGPLPHVQMMPSGGVSKDNLADWLEVGAFAVGIGSALTKNVKDGDFSSVQTVAQEFMDHLEALRTK